MRKLAGLVMVCGLVLIGPATTYAATYYLDGTAGNDTNDGSTGKPWKTFNHALKQLLPKDTLEVRAGTYEEQVLITASGSAGNPITVQAAAGAKVVISGDNTLPASQDEALVDVGGAYVTLKGFEVTKSKGTGVSISGNNADVSNLSVHDNQRLGIAISGGDDVKLSDSTVYQNVQINKAHGAGNNDAGVVVAEAAKAVLIGNTIYNNHNSGLVLSAASNSEVRSNTIYNNFNNNIYVDASNSIRIARNYIYCTANSGFEAAPQGGNPAVRPTGIGVGDSPTTSGNSFVNNLIARCGVNFAWYAEVGSGLKNVLIANNTMVLAQIVGMSLESGAHAGTTVTNNIVLQLGGSTTTDVGTPYTGLTFANNNWVGGDDAPPAGVAQASDVKENCELLSTAFSSPDHFRIPATSKCKDAGATVAKVTDDYFGAARPNGAKYDVGAHEVNPAAPVPDVGVPPSDGGVPTSDGGLVVGDTGAPKGDGAVKLDDAGKPIGGDGAKVGDGGVGGDGGKTDSGCSCEVGSTSGMSAFGSMLLIAMGLLFARRRNRK